jgi:uncharacterized protein YndB with AHSA1/START domain
MNFHPLSTLSDASAPASGMPICITFAIPERRKPLTRTITIRKTLPYSPAIVWKALTDARRLGEWFMPNDLEPVLNHVFTFRKPPQKGWDGITYCQITELTDPGVGTIPEYRIAYTYKGRASGEKTLACADIHSEIADKAVKGIFAELHTVLRFSLHANANGTTLVMEHSGFSGLKLIIVSLVMERGWKKLLKEKLPKVLDEISREL